MKNNIKNQKYWEDRIILKDKLLEKDINKIEKKLLKLFKDTRKEVLNELKIIYADIESTEYAKYRIDSLLMSIDNTLDNLYKKNEEQIEEGLKEIYKRFDKEASIDLGASFNTINENLIREAIKTNWSGLSFSERIWEHRRRLAFTIKGELTKGLTRGDSLQDISRIIADKLNNSYSNALRLVRTESCFIMNEATINNYKENGIKEYEFMAFLDKKTSPQCRELDGKIISIEEYKAGLNFPPLHPNCRSCIIPVVEEFVPTKKEDINNIYNNEKVEEVKEFNFKNSKEANKFIIEKFGFEKSNIGAKVDINVVNSMIKEIDGILNKYPQLNGYVRGFESGAMKAYAYYGQKLETDKFYNCLKVSTTNTNSLKDLMAMYERDLSKNFHPKGTTWEDIIVHEYGHIIEAYLGAKRVGVNNPKWNMSIEDARASFKYLKTGKISKEIIEEAFKNLNVKTAKDKFNITSELSKYATQDTREFLAEAFADAMRNGDNAQDISKEIIKIIDREMKG